MKIKRLALLCAMILVLALALPVYAAENVTRLADNADLLTDAEEQELLAELDSISENHDMDVVVVTIDDLYGENITATADDYYDYHGFGVDGVLLMVSEYDREWAISTAGYGITAFTDAGIDYMSSCFVDEMSDGDYYSAFHEFAELCDEFILQARQGRPYDSGNLPRGSFNFLRFALISLGVGLFVALLVTGTWRSKLKTVYSRPDVNQCVRPGSLVLTNSREIFLYRQVHRTKRVKSSSGSSTHTSSSGRSHGGRSGSF